MIKKIDGNILTKYQNIIKPPRNESLQDLIFMMDDKLWYVNTVGNIDPWRSYRAYFAYLIGKTIVNIPEISLLDQVKVNALHNIGVTKASINCFIIRVAHEYSTDELPLKSLDEAVAGELVFSLWIRRRDTHVNNRVYNTDGIPIFFDFDVAFLSENKKKNKDIICFFNDCRTGYAGQWQVCQKPNSKKNIDNKFVKGNGTQNSIHYVESLDNFKKLCFDISDKIITLKPDISDIAKRASLSDFDTKNSINFLMEECDNLKSSVKFMLGKVLNH